MIKLALDLDETLIATVIDRIHPAQDLSDEQGYYYYYGELFKFSIINSKKIAALITEAFDDYDGVMVLTSGRWDPRILEEIARVLSPYLREEIKDKFLKCRFHSAVSDARLFDMTPEKVALMPKCQRLKKIKRRIGELNNTHIMLLDNDEDHVDSFDNQNGMSAVLAPTDTDDTSYCEFASVKMHYEYLKQQEDGDEYELSESDESAGDSDYTSENEDNFKENVATAELSASDPDAYIVIEELLPSALNNYYLTANESELEDENDENITAAFPLVDLHTASRKPFRELLSSGTLLFKNNKAETENRENLGSSVNFNSVD